jgi:putative PIN family toxin of toxin-antitoxin system
MHKIILDTNVLVSSLIQKNYPYLVVELCIEKKAIICLSDDLLKEYIGVLNRPKFSRFRDFKQNADLIIARLNEMAVMYHPDIKVSLIGDDADNRLLELAEVAKADFLITGNTNDFTFDDHKGTRIVTPKEYWEKYK